MDKSVYKKMAEVQKQISEAGIEKSQTNAHHRFKFRGIDDVMNALSPILSKNNLLVMPSLIESEIVGATTKAGGAVSHARVKVSYVFIDGDTGSESNAVVFPGEALDNSDKSIGKAMSYAYKTACLQTFCIPLEAQEDPDKVSIELDHMLGRIKSLLVETGVDERVFLEAMKFGKSSVDMLTGADRVRAINALEKKKKKKKEEDARLENEAYIDTKVMND